MTEYRCTFGALGTTWNIHLPHTEHAEAERIVTVVKDRIEHYEATYSRFRPNSLVTTISKSTGSYLFPEDARMLFETYRLLYDLTEHKVTPLIGQVLVDAGYDMNYSLTPKPTITEAPEWDSVMSYTHPTLTIQRPVMLDFGAIGKGYMIDIVAEILEAHHVPTYTIDAGGDIRYKTSDHTPLTVGLENPSDDTQVVGTAHILNASICGSSGNRRAWRNYTHIIDPDTATSPTHISALWVVARTTRMADALTTALFFVEPHILREHIDFEYAILYSSGIASMSPSFPGTFFQE